MEPEWIAACLTALDRHPDMPAFRAPRPPAEQLQGWERDSQPFGGPKPPILGDLLGMEEEPEWEAHAVHFRRMIDHPAVIARAHTHTLCRVGFWAQRLLWPGLRWMMGSGFGVSAPGVRTLIQSRGDAGSALHAGGFPLQRHSISAVRNGRTHADYVNVVFVLRDVAVADGGFVSPLDHGAISSGSDSPRSDGRCVYPALTRRRCHSPDTIASGTAASRASPKALPPIPRLSSSLGTCNTSHSAR